MSEENTRTETKTVSPYDFCADLTKDIVTAAPFDRKAIATGYAKTLEAMLQAKYEEGKKDAS